MKKLFPNTHAFVSLVVLTVGQVLYLFGFRALFFFALIYFVAAIAPYPHIFRSMLSRVIASFVICMSLLQLVAAIQFYIFPHSGFVVISLVTYALCVVAAIILARRQGVVNPPLVTRQDVSALVMVSFFMIPVGLLFFKSLDGARILSFISIQSPDGFAHFNGIVGMEHFQHLDYRIDKYYPRGFHLASAFILDALHLDERNLTWLQNERLFAMLYVVWGALLSYVIYLFSLSVLQDLVPKPKRYAGLLLGLTLGPIITLLFLVPFIYLGFLNYYYICGSVLVGLLFLLDYDREKMFDWPLVVYSILSFGVSMSWGPLYTPALLLIPILYVMHGRQIGEVLALVKNKRTWAFIGTLVVGLVPAYMHVRYAHLTGGEGINAVGIITDFHYEIDIVGLAILTYLLTRERLSNVGKMLLNNLLAFYILLGVVVALQYFTTGELHYYAIKISYLVEMIVLATSAAVLVSLAWKRINSVHTWIGLPLVFSVATVLILGMTSDPFLAVRQTFRHYSHYPNPQFYDSDVASFAKLGEKGKIIGNNNEVLHYNVGESKIFGDGLVQAAASALQYYKVPPQMQPTDNCHWMIYQVLVYGQGTAFEQQELKLALQQCIAASQSQHVPYFVVTDRQSVIYLRPILGSYVQFVY